MPRQPPDLRHRMTLDIRRELEVNEVRIKGLAINLTEDLMISGCSHLQGTLALIVALTMTLNAYPAGTGATMAEVAWDLIMRSQPGTSLPPKPLEDA